MFIITGPGSPSVLSNVMTSIEQHVEWIAELLGSARGRGHSQIEADAGAEDAWVNHVREVAAGMLAAQTPSWWNGANVPGKPRVFLPYPGGVGNYRRRCAEIAAEGYPGFVFGSAPGIGQSLDRSVACAQR